MTITDLCQRVEISRIRVDRGARHRREFETTDLELSISRIGLIHPVVVTRDLSLKAGERRLEACRRLGHSTILCRFLEDLSPREAQIVELEENVKRRDLRWQDLVFAVARIHELYQRSSGEAPWFPAKTAAAISQSEPNVAKYLTIAREMADARISGAATINEAYNLILRRRQREEGLALDEMLQATAEASPAELPDKATLLAQNSSGQTSSGVPITISVSAPAPPSALCTDFRDWAEHYSGPKFNLIHCDFPYGIGLFDGPQGRAGSVTQYDDTPTVFWDLLSAFCLHRDRFCSTSTHLMFWYPFQYQAKILSFFEAKAPEFKFHRFPLIWLKSDNAGIASDPRRGPRHIYETALLAARGDRNIVRVVADAYSAPSDHSKHHSAKPEPMLRHFFSMLVDASTSLLDPTVGAGSSLRAAESLGAERVLGIDSSRTCVDIANSELRQARLLRKAKS